MRPDDAFASTRIERARGHYPSLCESLSALSRRLYVSRLSAVLNGMTLALNLVLCLWLVASEGRPAQEGVFLTLEGLVTASLLGELVRPSAFASRSPSATPRERRSRAAVHRRGASCWPASPASRDANSPPSAGARVRARGFSAAVLRGRRQRV